MTRLCTRSLSTCCFCGFFTCLLSFFSFSAFLSFLGCFLLLLLLLFLLLLGGLVLLVPWRFVLRWCLLPAVCCGLVLGVRCLVLRVRLVLVVCVVLAFGSSRFLGLLFALSLSCRFFSGVLLVVLLSLPAGACSSASSPVPCSAPFVSWVVPCARAAGASWLCLRPSSHSFSGWVLAVSFSSSGAAGSFAARASWLLSASACSPQFSCGVSFVSVRPCGSWWRAYVPVSVVWGSVPASSCPVLFASVS